MDYKSVFAVANENLKSESDYILKNYDRYEPKLDKEFYYKSFVKHLLFEVNILEIEEFLDYHYCESFNPELFIKILTRKVLSTINNVVSNAELDFSGGPYNDKKLEDGFVESDGLIFNRDYEMNHFYHITAIGHLEEDLNERYNIIKNHLIKIKRNSSLDEHNMLKWIGKPSHLGFIINQLIDYGYIEAPRKNNTDINISELVRNISSSIKMSNGSTSTLIEYSKESSLNFIKLKERFKSKGFYLPHRSEFD